MVQIREFFPIEELFLGVFLIKTILLLDNILINMGNKMCLKCIVKHLLPIMISCEHLALWFVVLKLEFVPS